MSLMNSTGTVDNREILGDMTRHTATASFQPAAAFSDKQTSQPTSCPPPSSRSTELQAHHVRRSRECSESPLARIPPTHMSQAPGLSRLPRLASPSRSTSIPTLQGAYQMAPLGPSINVNKRKTPSSPMMPTKRQASNPLSVSTSAGLRQSQRKPSSGFVPTTTRRPSSTLTVPRTASSGPPQAKRTASTGSTGSASSVSTTATARTRPAGIAATRRPPLTASTMGSSSRSASGLTRSVGPGRGVSPGAAAGSGIGSGMVGTSQFKVSWCMEWEGDTDRGIQGS